MTDFKYNSRCIKLRKHLKTHIVGEELRKSRLPRVNVHFVKFPSNTSEKWQRVGMRTSQITRATSRTQHFAWLFINQYFFPVSPVYVFWTNEWRHFRQTWKLTNLMPENGTRKLVQTGQSVPFVSKVTVTLVQKFFCQVGVALLT